MLCNAIENREADEIPLIEPIDVAVLYAVAANTRNHHFGLLGHKPLGQLYGRHCYFIKAYGFFTFVTDEMYVVVVVVALLAIIFTEGIFDAVIGGRDMVDDPFFNKSLQSPVNSYPIKSGLYVFFDVGMCKCTSAVQKEFQYLFPSGGNA